MEKVYSFLFFVVFYFCFLWHFVFVFCGVPASKFYSKTANDMTSTLWRIERSVTFRGVGRVKYLQITLYSFTMCIMAICIILLMQFLFTIIEDTRTGQTVAQYLLQVMQAIKIIGTESFSRLDFVRTNLSVSCDL